MDFNTIMEKLPIIAIVLAIVLLQFFLRRRKPEGAYRETAQSLLAEVKLNQAMAETFHLRQKPKKFETVSWRMNKTKLGFLGESTQRNLSSTFAMVEEFNQQIDAAKKYKTTSYLVSMSADRLKEPLVKSRQGLEDWLLAKVGTIEPTMKYPGMFDGLFGGRD